MIEASETTLSDKFETTCLLRLLKAPWHESLEVPKSSSKVLSEKQVPYLKRIVEYNTIVIAIIGLSKCVPKLNQQLTCHGYFGHWYISVELSTTTFRIFVIFFHAR